MRSAAQMLADATASVQARLDGRSPTLGIVLGSGLGALTDEIDPAVRIPYGDVPGFHVPTVPGHKGELVVGTFGGKTVIAQSGRFHLYEGHDAAVNALPIRLFATLGVEALIVTNAAGGIRRTFLPGTLMLLSDHLNLTSRNPLIGEVMDGEERFPDMSAPYDPDLRALAMRVALTEQIALEEGVYAGLLGPTYETPAEVRMLERFGADAVGMSTVLEVVAARARGVRCLGISLVTNAAAGISPTPLSHTEVMEVAAEAGGRLRRLVKGIAQAI